MTETINLILKPEGIVKLYRALKMLEQGVLPEVTIDAPEQHTRVRILKDPNAPATFVTSEK